jgi:two-component system chemotaxis sensor kinase CheA
MGLVGELVIERDRLAACLSEVTGRNDLARLNRISSDLQYSVMDVRLVQIGFLFNKFHRIVRDAASIEGKKVDLVLSGTETEIDRNILKTIGDSLIHLVRNCVAHGVEKEDERIELGKPATGTIKMEARAESDSVVLEITDDGKGLDIDRIKEKALETGVLSPELAPLTSNEEIMQFIFQPGFSSSENINELSGRGVGMDVVRKAIDSVGGQIEIDSQTNAGTTFRLILPNSMAVKSSLLLESGGVEVAIPLLYTEAVVSVREDEIFYVTDRKVISYLDQTIPLVDLANLLFPEKNSVIKSVKNQVVVVNHSGNLTGYLVDRLIQQKEIVEKPLQAPLTSVRSIGGVTIMGNGNVCLVLNIPELTKMKLSTKTMELTYDY